MPPSEKVAVPIALPSASLNGTVFGRPCAAAEAMKRKPAPHRAQVAVVSFPVLRNTTLTVPVQADHPEQGRDQPRQASAHDRPGHLSERQEALLTIGRGEATAR